MCSNLRWCSDGLEFTCWNGEVGRIAFIIDAFEREIIAWSAVGGARIGGSEVRDLMLEAVDAQAWARSRQNHRTDGSSLIGERLGRAHVGEIVPRCQQKGS